MKPRTKLTTLMSVITLTNAPFTSAWAQEIPPAARADSAATQTLTAAQLAEARKDGAAVAAKQGGWFWRAYGVGVVANVFGAAVILPIAALNEPLPPKDERLRIMPRGEAYEHAFEQGYISKMRKKRVWTSVAGVTLGTATMLGLFLASDPDI